MNKEELDELVARITPVTGEWLQKAHAHLDDLTKPRKSLGYLETLAARYMAIRQEERPRVGQKRVFVFAGDHGVVEEGVSAYPADVTQLMVANFIRGGAAINVLAKCAGAGVEVVDVGVAKDPGALPGLLRLNVRRGAANISRGPAMTTDEALKAIGIGVERVTLAAEQGVTLAGTGDMGIGNTTPAAALFSAYLNLPPEDTVGPGTGLDTAGVLRKIQVVETALAVNKKRCTDPLETLAALGGLEIAAICGVCLGGAACRIGVVVDGYISTAGALAAMRLCPDCKDYLFFSHMSAEPGHRQFFDWEGVRPILDLGMRLGEGTGGAIAMQIIEDAVAIYNGMATFSQAGITAGA